MTTLWAGVHLCRQHVNAFLLLLEKGALLLFLLELEIKKDGSLGKVRLDKGSF